MISECRSFSPFAVRSCLQSLHRVFISRHLTDLRVLLYVASNSATENEDINRLRDLCDIKSCVAVAVKCEALLIRSQRSLRSSAHFVMMKTSKGPAGTEVDDYYLESTLQGACFSSSEYGQTKASTNYATISVYHSDWNSSDKACPH